MLNLELINGHGHGDFKIEGPYCPEPEKTSKLWEENRGRLPERRRGSGAPDS